MAHRSWSRVDLPTYDTRSADPRFAHELDITMLQDFTLKVVDMVREYGASSIDDVRSDLSAAAGYNGLMPRCSDLLRTEMRAHRLAFASSSSVDEMDCSRYDAFLRETLDVVLSRDVQPVSGLRTVSQKQYCWSRIDVPAYCWDVPDQGVSSEIIMPVLQKFTLDAGNLVRNYFAINHVGESEPVKRSVSLKEVRRHIIPRLNDILQGTLHDNRPFSDEDLPQGMRAHASRGTKYGQFLQKTADLALQRLGYFRYTMHNDSGYSLK